MAVKRKDIPREIMAEPEEILGEPQEVDIVEVDPGTGMGDTSAIIHRFLNPDNERNKPPTRPIKDTDDLESAFYEVSSPGKFGKALAAERTKQKLTKVAIADAMKTSESSVRRIEKGSNPQSWDTIQRYAKALGKKIEIRFTDYDL